MKSKINVAPNLLILIPILIIFIIIILPSFIGFSYSLQSYDLTKPQEINFVFLKNYIQIFQDKDLRISIYNSCYYMFFVILFCIGGAIIGASIVNRKFRGKQALLAVIILPWALPQVVNAILWGYVFNPSFGFLNAILYKLHIIDNYIIWTQSRFLSLNIIALVLVWKILPLMIMIVLSQLQTIPGELYESARIDGADSYRCFLHITLPSIIGSLAIVLCLSCIIALNIFDEILIITGFRKDTMSLAFEAYLKAFRYLNFGYGSAIAIVLAIVGSLASIIYVRNLFREFRS